MEVRAGVHFHQGNDLTDDRNSTSTWACGVEKRGGSKTYNADLCTMLQTTVKTHAGKRVRRSLSETEEPELDPRTHAKNKTEPETNKKTKSAGVVACACTPRTMGETEAAASLESTGYTWKVPDQ